MSSLPVVINPNNIQQAPANLWFNVPVPATGGRIVLASNGSPATGAVWVAATTYLAGQQVVDTSGNLQRAVNSGTSGSTAPTWVDTIGGTVTDNTVTWECISLGPPYYGGAIDGAITPSFAPKIEAIMADQVAGPIDTAIVSAEATLEVTMEESDALRASNYFAGGIYGAGTDSSQPTGAQAYTQLTFGGIIAVPKLSVCCISARRNNQGKFKVAMLYRAYQAEAFSTPMTRTKPTMVKMRFTGLFDLTRNNGDQAGSLWEQV